MTNLEYIRTLSAEELACKIARECDVCAHWHDHHSCGEFGCESGITEWLNQEHKPKLKPCPFCGGEAVVIGTFWLRCSDCDVETPRKDTEAEAIEAWNRRAE